MRNLSDSSRHTLLTGRVVKSGVEGRDDVWGLAGIEWKGGGGEEYNRIPMAQIKNALGIQGAIPMAEIKNALGIQGAIGMM